MRKPIAVFRIIAFLMAAQLIMAQDSSSGPDIQGIYDDCFTQLTAACTGATCTSDIAAVHGCFDACTSGATTVYSVTACNVQNEFTCQVGTANALVLYGYLQQCLLNQQVTQQCITDETNACNSGADCLTQNENSQTILEQNIYTPCEAQIISNTYFTCFSDTLTTYSADPTADANSVTLAQGRQGYYSAQQAVYTCEQTEMNNCVNYSDAATCTYSVVTLHQCLQQACQVLTDPHQKYVCYLSNFEGCKTTYVAYNQLVKQDLQCIYSSILTSLTTVILYLLFLSFF